MSRHDTDVVGFFFGVCFLVCAGLAIGVRTGNLGFASDGPDGAWIAGALLAVVGLIGVIGTLSGLRRRSTTGPAGDPTGAMPAPVAPSYGPAARHDAHREPVDREPFDREPFERETFDRESFDREPFDGEAVDRRPTEHTSPSDEESVAEPSTAEPSTAEPVDGARSAARDLDADETQVLDPPDPVEE